jgi:hypothetical protein
MVNKYSVDYAFGTCNESTLLSTIKSHFGNDLECCPNKYSVVDFTSDTLNIELKSRRIKHNKYDTAMIGKNKIDYLLNDNKRGIIIYNYLDGLYYVEITKENVNKFNLGKGGRWDRGREEVSDIYYIPVEMLKLISQ